MDAVPGRGPDRTSAADPGRNARALPRRSLAVPAGAPRGQGPGRLGRPARARSRGPRSAARRGPRSDVPEGPRAWLVSALWSQREVAAPARATIDAAFASEHPKVRVHGAMLRLHLDCDDAAALAMLLSLATRADADVRQHAPYQAGNDQGIAVHLVDTAIAALDDADEHVAYASARCASTSSSGFVMSRSSRAIPEGQSRPRAASPPGDGAGHAP